MLAATGWVADRFAITDIIDLTDVRPYRAWHGLVARCVARDRW